MNTPAAPNDHDAPDPYPPGQRDGRSTAELIMIVGGWTLLGLLIIGILLPVFEADRRPARGMKNTTQVRGITQGLIVFAQGNKGRFPGVDRKGYLLPDVDDLGPMPLNKHGGTVEGRFWLLLDNNNFSGDYAISPSETKTVWTTGEVSTDNYSYAFLNIHSDGNPLPDDRTEPDQTHRAREWKDLINSQSVVVSDRACIPGGNIGNNHDKIYSIHTSPVAQKWAGSVGRGDGSASFNAESTLDTRYGEVPEIEADRLFARDQDPGQNLDIMNKRSAQWDDTANALLGYKSVGYQDPDIASD